jgi:uncharacterized membrane protein
MIIDSFIRPYHVVFFGLLLILHPIIVTASSNEATVLKENFIHTYVFECDNEYYFVARIEDEIAWLFLKDETVRLSKKTVSPDEKYNDENISFSIIDDEAILQVNNTDIHNCKNNRRKAIWEHAKLNGVHFRAVGNEPGWILEISEDIIFVTNYGKDKYSFSISETESNPELRVTYYKASNKTNDLIVKLSGEKCHDSMSDDAYETNVSVMLDDKQYSGCGRALH